MTRYAVPDCLHAGTEPCTLRVCRYSLLEWRPIKGPTPKVRLTPIRESNCALDYAAWGGMAQSEIASVFGVTRQAIEQTERAALRKLSRPYKRIEP